MEENKTKQYRCKHITAVTKEADRLLSQKPCFFCAQEKEFMNNDFWKHKPIEK